MKLVDEMKWAAAAEGVQNSTAPSVWAPRVLIRCEGHSVVSSARPLRRPWVLRGVPGARPLVDPLMGWCGDVDTHAQVEVRFSTLEAAMAFARRRGWRFEVVGAGSAPGPRTAPDMLTDFASTADANRASGAFS